MPGSLQKHLLALRPTGSRIHSSFPSKPSPSCSCNGVHSGLQSSKPGLWVLHATAKWHRSPCLAPALPCAQNQSSAGVNLWAAVPTVDWQHIMTLGFDKAEAWLEHSDALIRAAVAEAVDAGFPLAGKPEGGATGVGAPSAHARLGLAAAGGLSGCACMRAHPFAHLSAQPRAACRAPCCTQLWLRPAVQPAWRTSLWRCTPWRAPSTQAGITRDTAPAQRACQRARSSRFQSQPVCKMLARGAAQHSNLAILTCPAPHPHPPTHPTPKPRPPHTHLQACP